jgi:hypothetical protein
MRVFAVVAMIALTATSVSAQSRGGNSGSFNSGFKLEGNLHFNRSTVSAIESVQQPEHAYGLGLEFVGGQLGGGLYGYSVGRINSFNADTTKVVLVGEVNYYLPIQGLRIAPYVGVHSHLGTFDRSYFDDPFLPRPRDGLDDLGYQFGVRFKPFSFVGVDAQWRRQSESAWEDQSSFLERNQVLVGVVLF